MTEKKVRQAMPTDLDDILNIYDTARRFMEDNGNPTQWAGGYPPRQMLEDDIRQGRLFVVTGEEGVKGVFMFEIGPDSTYEYIEGSWRSDSSYGVIHRIAGIGGGVFAASLHYCLQQISHIRIDTHADNLIMQHMLTKHGFSSRGIIYVYDGSPRIAYDRI